MNDVSLDDDTNVCNHYCWFWLLAVTVSCGTCMLCLIVPPVFTSPCRGSMFHTAGPMNLTWAHELWPGPMNLTIIFSTRPFAWLIVNFGGTSHLPMQCCPLSADPVTSLLALQPFNFALTWQLICIFDCKHGRWVLGSFWNKWLTYTVGCLLSCWVLGVAERRPSHPSQKKSLLVH